MMKLKSYERTPEHRARMSEASKCKSNCTCKRHDYTPSLEKRKQISQTLMGHVVSDETRKAMSRAWTPERKLALARRQRRGTWPEQVMAALLNWAGTPFEAGVAMAGYQADFYLPETNSVIEVDGVHWHPNGPDKDRDATLLASGVSSVHHVTDVQLKEAGWL